MSGPWEDFGSQSGDAEAGPWAEFPADSGQKQKKKTDGILSDIGTTLVEGTKSAGRAIAGTANVYTGNEQGLIDKAKAQEQSQTAKPEALQRFNEAVATRSKELGEDPGLLDSIKAVGGAVLEQPKGAGLAIVEQLPNSAPAMAGGLAGMKLGGMAGTAVAPGVGTAVGGILGGVAGMFAGNTAIETGNKAIEAAQDGSVSPEEMAQIRKEGAIKGGVITGVDALTLGASKAITGAGARAVESATRKALTDAGVDVADKAAVLAARQSPEISSAVRAAQDTALASANTLGKRAASGGAALGLETVGEGVGEYFGELAATGKANMVDAVLESVLSLGQSGAEVAWGAVRNKKEEGAGLWNVSGGKYAETKAAEIAGLLPAPTYTGTPGDQLVSADAERQAAIDAADKNAAELYAAREEFEQKLRQSVQIINEPAPLQQRIDEMLRVDTSKLTGIERTNYEKQLSAAFAEPIGIRHDKDQREVPFTIGEYLDAQVALEDALRNREKAGRAAAESGARLQQLAEEEATQQPDILPPAVRGIMPSIPVVGPLSKAANAAVQSGAVQQTALQNATQAVAGAPAATAGGSRPAPVAPPSAPAAGPISAAATQAAAPSAQPATAPSQGVASTQGDANGRIAQPSDAQVAPAGNQGGRNDLPGSGNVLAPVPAGNANNPGNAAGLAQAGVRPAAPAGNAGATGVANQKPIKTESPAVTGGPSAAPVASQEPAASAGDDAYRPLIESLIKNKRNAKQLGFDIEGALQKAKDAMHGKKQMPGTFRKLADKAEKLGDKDTAAILRKIADMNDARKTGKKEAGEASGGQTGGEAPPNTTATTKTEADDGLQGQGRQETAEEVTEDTGAASSGSAPAEEAIDENNLDEPEGTDGWKRLGYVDTNSYSYPVDYRDIKKTDGNVRAAIRQIRIYDNNSASHMAAWEWRSSGFEGLKALDGLRIDQATFHYVLSDTTEEAFGDKASDGDALWAQYGNEIQHSLMQELGAANPVGSEEKPVTETPPQIEGPKSAPAAIAGPDSRTDKYAEIARQKDADIAALKKFKKGDSVSYVAKGTYTQKDGSEIVDPVRTGTITSVKHPSEGTVEVDGNIYIGARNLTKLGDDQTAVESDAEARFSKNTIFTADKVAAARARLKSKLGTMNSGIDPELLVDGMTIAGAYIESGVRKFGDYAKAMVADLGEGVKPYLLSFYEAARAYPGLNKIGMDSQESAASQHQAMLTPEVKAAAKEVIGRAPKVEKKAPTNLSEAARLKADYGVKNIDGYTRSKSGKNQETDYGLKGGIKDEFLADAKRYLKAVSKLLEDRGFETHVDNRGKGIAAVNSNEAGPAVSGDVYLAMRRGDFGVYAQIGVSSIRGIGPGHPQGVSLMVRVTPQSKNDRSATKGTNNWLDPMTSAGELVAWFDKQRQANEQRSNELSYEQFKEEMQRLLTASHEYSPNQVGFGDYAEKMAALSDKYPDYSRRLDAESDSVGAVDIPAASAKLEETAPAAPAIGEGNGKATGQQGAQALERVAPEQVRGTSGGESVADGGRSGGEGRGAGNAGTDGSRVQAGRSGGNRTAEVDTAAAGGNDRGRAGGKQRSGGQDGGAGQDRGQAGGSRSVHGELTPAAIPEANFEITEEVALGSGGQMTKYRDNVAAIKVLKAIEAERRRATAAEKKTLARYVGWGGIPNAFRNGVTGQVAKDWEKEVAELESLLTPRELRAAAASTRNAHYTAKEVVDFMWSAVRKMGFAGGMVLEPSVGTGNFIGLMPKEFASDSFVTGIELDSLTARIAGALYPKSTIVNTGFQKAALPSNRFKLAIGNPPFGAESLRFQYKPELNGASIHNQFFLGSLDALEPGGMMAMVVSRYLMDAKDATTREKLAIDAELLGAVRLPGSAFKGNALTEVVTDVLFFRKRDSAEAESLREAYFKRGKEIKAKDHKEIAEHQAAQQRLETALRWTKTAEVKDPLGGDPMVVSQYFSDRPGQVIGKMERSGSMRHGGDIDVTLEKGEKLADRLNALVEKMSQLPIQTQNEEARANSEQFHRAMGESLRLSAKGAEADAIYFDDDGDLATVIERVGERGDETALTTIKVTPSTPWSPSLAMDLDGKWFREVAKTDKDGKPVKAVDAKGKETKRNVYVREVFKRESDIPKSLLLGETKFSKMKALISMRDLLVKQIDLEVSRAAHEQMEGNRTELRQAYEAFVREYGYISDAKNAAIVSDMPDEGLLLSLETGYRPEVTEKKARATGMAPSPASAKPAAILSRPVAIQPAAIDRADTPSDALAVVMSESGQIDIKRVAELRDLSEEAAADELTAGDTPLAFKDPERGNALVEKNAYLSGNVRRKLEAAKQAGLEANIKALEAVQPEPWGSDKVTARMGSNWVPSETYGEFIGHLLGDKARVQYAKLTNTFAVSASGDSAAATSKWGTKRVPAPRLIENILNSTRIAVYDTDSDGNRHFNQTETDAANDKAKEIREEFDNWIFKDADRRAALTKLFNDIFNTRVTPQYDGSHLKFPGKVPDEIISLRRGQINAVWRGIIDDAVLYDHAVGAGKTFTGIARVMERRRMGMSKKPMIVVPNHMVGEWAAQAYRLYPGARILAATKKDLETKNRRRLFAKIASGDWDMVIVPHSSFQFISISPETEERILLEELATAQAALKEAEEEADPGSRFKPLSVKEAEALIEKIEKRLETARGKMGKDRLLTFEQMGVDDLTIDESHEFKNLFYSSNLTDVRGMGNKQGSNKAFDLYSKTRVIRDGDGSLAFLTGTPISNSAVELYNILRYLAPGTLQESGLEHFDAFRSQYVDATAKFEPTDSGGGLKLVTRLGRSWSNMRSLMELYYSVADVVTNDDIKRWFAEDNPGKEFPLPKVKGGDRQAVSVKPTPAQMRLLEETIAAFNGLDAIEDVKERNAERLRLMDRARKLSLHAKAVDPRLNDEAGGKLDVVADKAAAIYQKWMTDKGTQLIFLDRGVPKAKGDAKIIKEYDELTAKLREASLKGDEDAAQKIIDRLEKFDANEISELRLAQESNWNGYQHIKDRLVSLGVPANEIAFVQDFDGDAAKEQLFQAVRDGAIRILLGSSPRMGAGTNVQERLVALHHVDATWKPSDIEQREGRIIRQGNALLTKYGKDFEVEILAYVTERTVDAKLWDLNSTKLRMINAIRYYDGAFEMDFDDEAAVGMAEIAAIASGDPLLLERFKLATEIDNLYRQRRSHRRRVESAEDSLRSAKRLIENAPKEIQEAKEDAKLRDEFVSALSEAVDSRRMVMDGKEYRHADLTKARMDLENFAGAIGDDEKFSITIDGKEFTSKGGAEEAIQIALGDAEPFVATVGGKTITRRSDYARALRERIGERIDEDSTVDAFDAGAIAGVPVRAEVVSKFGGPAIFVGVTGTYESTGRRRSIVGHRYLTPEKHKSGEQIPVTVNGLRPVIADFERSALSLRDNSDDIAKRAERAKSDMASLEEQVGEPFKGSADLEQKSARLAEVEAELSGRKAAEEAPSIEQNEGLGNIAEDEIFYSQLARAIASSPERMFSTAPQVKAWLASNAGKLGIKKDEIQWSGINEYLDTLGKGKVSKADVLAYLEQGGVQVQEVMKGATQYENFVRRVEAKYGKDKWQALLTGEEMREFDSLPEDDEANDSKYAQYQLPGGEDYRELLLTLPVQQPEAIKLRNEIVAIQDRAFDEGRNMTQEEVDRSNELRIKLNSTGDYAAKKVFRSNHWDEPNILAHVRFNSRTDADGAKVLFIEEVQSDWGQKGKKEGFIGDPIMYNGKPVESGETITQNAPPSAPFVTDTKSWVALALKRMMRYAADNGFEKIAFINGEQSADRYDLSKQVDAIQYRRNADGTFKAAAVFKQRGNVNFGDNITEAELADHVGKEVAEKMANGDGVPLASGPYKQLTGLDLKVGGEGMKTFYDQIVPQVANDLLKKMGGGKVGEVALQKQAAYDPESGSVSGLLDYGVWPKDGKFELRGRAGQGVIGVFETSDDAFVEAVRLQNEDGLKQPGFTVPAAAFGPLPLFQKTKAAQLSQSDKAIYSMAAEGNSVGEILKFIASASRSPFNRQLAKLLLKTGIAPKITVGDAKGWRFNAGNDKTYAAAYSPKTDTVALFRPAAAERNMLHELMHAATLKALGRKGLAAGQMRALFAHVKKSGALKGMYGMSDVDEFVAEAFTNPKFQDALKKVAAPKGSGTLSSAWHWFVRVVRGILGLKANDESALSAALEIGLGVMREDMQIRRGESGVPFSEITGREIERTLGRTLQEKATNWMRLNLQGKSFENDATGWDIAVGRKGINKAMSHGARDVHARSVAAIPDLLKHAILVASESNNKTVDRMDIAAVHHFYAPFRMGGEVYIARMVVKETRGGQRFYDYDTSDVIRPTNQGADAHLPKEGAASRSAGREMSMANLLSHVKAEHGGTDPRFKIRHNVAEFFRGMGIEAGASGKMIESIRSDVQFVAGRDEKTGFPTWKGAHVSLSSPRDVTESHDVFYRPMGGERAVKYDIRSANGQIVGHTVLEIDGDWPTMLLDIEVQKQHRGNRYAEKAVAGIVADAGEIGIWHIVPSARSWWERIGTQTVDAHNGTLAFNDYADARSGREDAQSLGEDVGIRYNIANEAHNESYDLPEERIGNRSLYGAELETLRRAAARLEDAERGVTFRVTEDGQAVVTGPARFNIPDRFKRFAEKHGLTFKAERGSARLRPDGTPERTRIGAMPENYRVSGALYAQEVGSNYDRTDRTRFNVADDGWSVSEPSKMDDVLYALQDKHIDTKRVVQAIIGAGKKIRDAFNPYLQEELFHGRAAKGVKDFLDFELRPLLKDMQSAGVEMGDFEEYLWNRHAEERNRQVAKVNPDMKDGGSGIKTADARAYLSGLPAETKAKYEQLAKRIDAISRNSQGILVSSGLETQETIDAWNGAYQHYVPLQREDVDSGHVGTGKGFSVRGSATKRAMGSGRKVVDIIGNLTMQRERNIVRAEKNRVSQAVMGLAVTNPNPDFWTVDKAPKERVVQETTIYSVLDEAGNKVSEFTRMDDADKAARAIPNSTIEQTWEDRVTERVTPGFLQRDNVLLTRINGQDHYVIFNEREPRAVRMAQAMKNLDADNLGAALSVIGRATRYLASVNTQYNPVFGVINLIRDSQGAMLNLASTPLAGEQKRVLGYTVDALRGIYADIRAHRAGRSPSSNWAQLFEEFQKEGGQTGYRDQYAGAEQRAEAIKSELAQFTEGAPKRLLRGVFGWLSDYNETMENAVRLASYKAAKEKGMSRQQAASLAKNITVNFNRKGQVATQVGALYAFFNASVQGTARIAETLFEPTNGDGKAVRLSKLGKKIVAGGIMLGSMQALLLAAAGYDDDEPPEFVRERNLVMPIGDGKYLTLAMPLGFHVLPGIGRIATEFAMSGFKDPAKRALQFGSMLAEAFNPVGNAGFSLQTITPSVVDPFAALAENKDFTGKEIYRKDFNSMKPTPGHARAKDVSTFYARYISEALNFITGGTEFKPGVISPSPDAIDYLVGQATGGVGREANKIFQTGSAAMTGEDLPLYKMPLVGRFVGDTEGQSGQSAKFYAAIKQINMHKNEYKGLMESSRGEEAREYMLENPETRLIMAGNHAETQVRKLRSMKRDLIKKDADKARVREIDDRISETMRRFNERVAAAT